jgi:hypothetical protein
MTNKMMELASRTRTDEILALAETLGDVKARAEKIEAEFTTQAKALEAATTALSATMAGINAMQSHVLAQELAALRAEVEQLKSKL